MANEILVNISEFLHTDMHVFDSSQEKLGTVKMFNDEAGYLMVEKGMFAHKDLYIPFRLIRTIDPKEIFLKSPKNVLETDYSDPPALTVHKEEQGSYIKEASVVNSGFDNRPVIVNRVDVQEIAHQLKEGMNVYDVGGEYVGSLTQFDSSRSMMTVEYDLFPPQVLFIPFSLISSVYTDAAYLLLTLPKDALKKDLSYYTRPPA